MIVLKEKIKNKIGYNNCTICGQEISSNDIKSNNFEYIKTRRNRHALFCHTSCIERRKHGNSNK